MQVPIKFSIVLPTYNRATLLAATILSVQKQSYPYWELIVVDDGSKDNTQEIIAKIQNLDERVKYIFQNNAERSAARNNGILQATGQFICFLDSDDAYDPNHLMLLQQDILNANNTQHIFISLSKAIYQDTSKQEEVNIQLGNNDFETILLNSITPGQICVPKELMTQVLFNQQIRISEDTELLFRLVEFAPLKISKHYTFLYHLHEDNSVNFKKYNAFAERKKTLEIILNYPNATFVSSKIKRSVISNCYFGIVKYYVAKNQFINARWNLLKAIFLYPSIRLKEKIYLFLYPKKAL